MLQGLDTLDDPTQDGPEPGVACGLRVVVLWHRDPRRIGRRAWVASRGPGDVCELSRQDPVFCDGRGLDDPRISRSPLQLVAVPEGVECWPTRPGMRFDVDGVPGTSGMVMPMARLAAGVRLGLGRGALLHLQIGPRPQPSHGGPLVGVSEAFERLLASVEQAAASTETVLLEGESGTGKELVARAIHAGGARRAQALVAVNMAAIGESLGPSQLFGHVRGAFTGASQASPGLFGSAHRGTLFLDEIGACPIEVQAQLLRVLESGEAQVVGGPSRRFDVRVVAASDADLEAACASGTFRPPLYHRLARRTIRIPPLRERTPDIAVQAVHFLTVALREAGREWPDNGPDGPAWLGRDVLEALLDWVWPGNTRELRSVVIRIAEADAGQPACMPPRFRAMSPVSRATTVNLDTPDPELGLREALAACDYRLGAAADRLGISRNTLKRRMDAENIRRPADIPLDEIEAVVARTGSVAAAARVLGVSEHGLKLRIAGTG